jgi:hypothetical protein
MAPCSTNVIWKQKAESFYFYIWAGIVSFIYINSCRKDLKNTRNPLHHGEIKLTEDKEKTFFYYGAILSPTTTRSKMAAAVIAIRNARNRRGGDYAPSKEVALGQRLCAVCWRASFAGPPRPVQREISLFPIFSSLIMLTVVMCVLIMSMGSTGADSGCRPAARGGETAARVLGADWEGE